MRFRVLPKSKSYYATVRHMPEFKDVWESAEKIRELIKLRRKFKIERDDSQGAEPGDLLDRVDLEDFHVSRSKS